MAMSPEMRAKLSQMAKERHAARKTASVEAAGSVPDTEDDLKAGLDEKQTIPPEEPEQPLPAEPSKEEEPMISVSEYRDLLRQIQELKANASVAYPSGPQVNSRGKMTGTYEKYVVDPANYPDPSERLASEPRLRRFAFPINYELKFIVTTTQYQTQDGVNTREPKFTVELIKIVMDDDTGEPTKGRYVLRTAVFHEDPQAALILAREQGLDPQSFGGEKNFLDEMRYLRMRDWLVEAFYPPKRTDAARKKDVVIGNRLVQFYEVSSQESSSIDFKGLQGKV